MCAPWSAETPVWVSGFLEGGIWFLQQAAPVQAGKNCESVSFEWPPAPASAGDRVVQLSDPG